MNESVTNETGSKDSSQLYFYLFVIFFVKTYTDEPCTTRPQTFIT